MNLNQTIEAARNVLRFKHMAVKTEKSYVHWSRGQGCGRRDEPIGITHTKEGSLMDDQIWKAVHRMEAAAYKASQAAQMMENAAQRIALMFEHGYGGNGLRLIELLSNAVPDPQSLRNMLRAMQNGELTVSRGVELVSMWLAGNYRDDMLPPVREGLGEDEMPWDRIDSLTKQSDELLALVAMVKP